MSMERVHHLSVALATIQASVLDFHYIYSLSLSPAALGPEVVMGRHDLVFFLSTHSVHLTGSLRLVAKPTDPRFLRLSFCFFICTRFTIQGLGHDCERTVNKQISFCFTCSKIAEFLALPWQQEKQQLSVMESICTDFGIRETRVQILIGLHKDHMIMGLFLTSLHLSFLIQKKKKKN